jgi:glycerate 2-kinase
MRILAAALDAVEPGKIVQDNLQQANLPKHDRIFLLGIGKAAEPMTRAVMEVLPDFTDALIVTKHASGSTFKQVSIIEGGHPIPDESSLAAGKAVLKFVSQLKKGDLLICLISGGGSALVTVPQAGLLLQDIQLLTSALLASGATIDEINTIRRRLDQVKGGELARRTNAKIVSLILSDVIEDRLEAIASGPTAPDPTTHKNALLILRKYNLERHTPAKILTALASRSILNDDSIFQGRVQNIIIGNNQIAVRAANQRARSEGFNSEILKSKIQGEARIVGQQMADTLIAASDNRPRPFCLVGGGETTVTIHGDGKGGRNQELALAAVDKLESLPGVLLISLATDGEDGPTDAAGAVVNGETHQRAARLGMLAPDYLSRNDAYPFFDSLDDLLKPDSTGTNVNDLVFLIRL